MSAATFFGPTPYLSSADIPAGLYVSGAPTVLEDFEDGNLDPSIIASAGKVVPPGSEGLIDSVDGDDGLIDGSGLKGHSWFTDNAMIGVKFTFPPGTIAAGVVWTDGNDPVTFAAFGPGNTALGTIGPVNIADTSYAGTTGEDRFFGVRDPGGIESLFINSTGGGGLEVDHVQYELAGGAPSNFAIPWHSIGPGGTSGGGDFSINGAISQPTVAGAMFGDDFTLESNFPVWGSASNPEPDGTIIFDNTSGSDNGGFGVTETNWLAGKFCVGSQPFSLDSISLLLNSQDFSGMAGPPSTLHLQLYSHDSLHDKPLASIGVIMNLAGHTNPVALLDGQELVKWVPSTSFELESNACYWAVLSRDGGGNIAEIGSFTQPNGAVATLGASSSGDGGTTWQVADPGYNFKMIIQGTASTTPFPITQLIVPGTANPWLAGMTNGFAEPSGDVTPANSPVLFSGFAAGMRLQFNVPDTDRAGYEAGSESGPEGLPGVFLTHGAQFGIGEIRGAQANALLGVFLDNSQPGANPTPLPLDFTPDAARNYLELKPELNQPFYIGNGSTTDGIPQTVIAPANATRLFLGITDGAGWSNNSGAFHVTVSVASGTSAPSPELGAGDSTPIPGGSGNFTTLPFAPALSGDDLVFFGGGVSGQQGVYSTTRGSQSITRIADLNTAIPTGTGNFLSFGTDAGIIIVGGNVLFQGRGSGGQQGLYVAAISNPTATTRIADSSTPIPNGTGTFAQFLNLPAFNGIEVAFVASGSDGQPALYKAGAISPPQAGLLQLIANTTMAIPEGDGSFTAFPSAPALGGSDVAFIANGSAGQQGLYKVPAISPPQVGSPFRIADINTPIPNGIGNFTAFGSDQAHPINPAAWGERLAFVGSGSGDQQGVYTTVGGIPPSQTGSLARIADTTTAIPGGNGNFTSFDAVSVSQTDTAFLADGTGGQRGIYDMTGGQLRKVISVGESIQGKTIIGLKFGRGGLDGDPVAFQASFSDGSEGIFTLAVPSTQLRITSVENVGSDLRLTFTSAVGETYVVQSRSELSGGAWTTLPVAPIPGTGSTVELRLANALVQPTQFYRVQIVAP